MKFLIGQRVIVGSFKIGVISSRNDISNLDNSVRRGAERDRVFVDIPGGFVSEYDWDNVKPLPNGQL